MSRAPKPTHQSAEFTEGPDHVNEPLERLAYRFDDLPEAIGISRRTIERERSAGRFPKPDRIVGRMPLWSPKTIRKWIEGGGR